MATRRENALSCDRRSSESEVIDVVILVVTDKRLLIPAMKFEEMSRVGRKKLSKQLTSASFFLYIIHQNMLSRTIPRTPKAVVTATTTRSIASTSYLHAAPRQNKRHQKSSRESSLSSLISLYHLSSTFAPLSPSSLGPYIDHAIIPKSTYRTPTPLSLLDLARSQNILSHEIEKVQHVGSIVNADISLSTSLQNNGSFDSEVSGTGRESYGESFEKKFTVGAEPPLSGRMRRVMDVLHGTEGGGQAGLRTLEEAGPAIMEMERYERGEEEKMRVLEESSLEEDERR